MRVKVPPPLVEILNTRIYIAKETKLFDYGQIAESWTISRATLLRYNSPAYRELSRASARRMTELQKTIDKSKCQLCSKALKDHARCLSCTMLFHGVIECGCIDTAKGYTVMVQ